MVWGWIQECGSIEANKVVSSLKVLKCEKHTKNVWKLYVLAYWAFASSKFYTMKRLSKRVISDFW